MSLWKKIASVGLTASMLAAQAGCSGALAEAQTPAQTDASEEAYNVLFITVDQEHFFSEYPEGSNYKARQLLAELGTTFEKHYCCSNMSTSSRAVMFTGLHIPLAGMIDNTDFVFQAAMDDSLTTIGDMMREAGYYSAIKGKWHLGDASLMSDESELTDLNDYGYSDWGGKDYIGSVREGNEMDPVVVSEALDWLENTGKSLNAAGQPFFLNVNMINPHDIMNYDATGYESSFMQLADKPDDPLYDKTYDVPIPATWDFDVNAPDVPDALRLYQEHWGLFAGVYHDPDVWQDYQNYYFNCIQDSDNNLMNILDYLMDNGMMDNTVIVFTADHGEMQGSHGLKGKGGFMYENNVHVPLIIVHPDYEGGRTVSTVTSHLDLAPTIVDLTNLPAERKAEITAHLHGKSLMPLVSGAQERVRDAALFCFQMLSMTAVTFEKGENGEYTRTLDVSRRGMVRGIATEQYKFVRYFTPIGFNMPTTIEDLYANNDVQLFDLKADPDELVNLAADPEANAELIMQMNDLMNRTILEEIGEDKGENMKKVLQYIKDLANAA